MQKVIAAPAFIGGKKVEWADQRVYVNGVRLLEVKGNKHGVTTDKAHLFLEGDDTFGIQSGNREPTGMLKLEKSAVDVMNAIAIAAGGRDVTDVEFDIVTVYKAVALRGMQRMTQVGCQVKSFEYGWEQNAKEMIVELPYLYLKLVFG